jgi:hypothetical protein
MNSKIKYNFSAKVWHNTWYFISLPEAISSEIRAHLKWQEEGWGRLKVTAKIGNSQWETAIWFDTNRKTYLLPIKAEIRRKEKIESEEEVEIVVWV